MQQRFKPGDTVVLTRPFRCSDDDPEYDEDLDKELRGECGPIPEGVVLEAGKNYYKVKFEGYRELYVDEEPLDSPEPTEDEVAEAIRSITGGA